MNWQLYLVLGTPLLGSMLLALWGHKTWAAGLNIAMSIATFIAAAALTARIISEGPLVTSTEQFFVDSLNVFLVALTAFVSMTTSLFSRPYMRIEHAHGKLSDNPPAAVPRHYSPAIARVHHVAGAAHQQPGAALPVALEDGLLATACCW